MAMVSKGNDSAVQRRIKELVNRRWMNTNIRRWAQLGVGVLLLGVVGMIAAHYITLFVPGISAHFMVYWMIVVGVMIVLLIAARQVKQSLFGQEASYQKPEVNSIGMPRYSSYGEQELVVFQLSLAVVLDIALSPAGWIVKVVEEFRFLKAIGDLNVPMATDLVARLLAKDQGMSLAAIKRPIDSMDAVLATVAHLRLLEIVDRSDKRDLVWLPSVVREELAR